MASNVLYNKAKKGTCRICQRSRNTGNQVKAVGEVRHGFATGHIWECVDTQDCDKSAIERLQNWRLNEKVRGKIEAGLKRGRFTEYLVLV
jgi:predicted methyltransferase MtxX (methanogen marker protein 4)